MKSTLKVIAAVAAGLAQTALLVVLFSWIYTNSALAISARAGIYDTPEQGMVERMERGYRGNVRVVIEKAGPNAFDDSDPHVWYVIAKVYADRRADGTSLGSRGYDYPGSFYLHTRQGWVHMSEGFFPEFIGFWMKVFHLAG